MSEGTNEWNEHTVPAQRVEVLREIIKARRSCRKFRPDPVSKVDLMELVEAGIWAPSGSNAQNQRFLIVDDRETIERIGADRWMLSYATRLGSEEARERFPYGLIGSAGALIFVFADSTLNNRRNNGEYYLWETLETQNCAASMQNILLLAAAKGLGSCWVSATEHMNYTRLLTGHRWREVLAEYDLPRSYKIQGLIMLGWPASADEAGYARGEALHGVARRSTERDPTETYLVRRKEDESQAAPKAGRSRVRFYRNCIGMLLRAVQFLDRRIYRLEMGE